MKNDSQLKRLEPLIAFDLAEQVRPVDELWWQVNEGTLSPSEAVDRMLQLDPELDAEQLRWQAELFAPPSEEECSTELDRVLHARFRPSVVKSRRQVGLLLASGATGLAAAAALLLFLWPTPPEPTPEVGDPIPAYQLDWQPWEGPELGPETPSSHREPRFHADHRLEVYLRPTTRVQTDVAVTGWAQSTEGRDLALKLIATIHDEGTIEIKQPISELGLTPGEWTITFVVGPPDRLRDPKAMVDLEPSQRPDIAILRDSVWVVE